MNELPKNKDVLSKSEMKSEIMRRLLAGNYSGIHHQSRGLNNDLTFWITSGEKPSNEDVVAFLIELIKVKPGLMTSENFQLQKDFDEGLKTFLFNTIRASAE